MIGYLMILVIYGCVIQSHGCVYVDNHNLNLVTVSPNNTLLTESLKIGGNYVGMTYSKLMGKPFIILKFDVKGKDYCLKYFARGAMGNPLRLAIYVSQDGKKWKLVRVDIADTGNYTVLLPPVTPRYIKIEGIGSKYGGTGASLFDTFYLVKCKKNKYAYKINLNNPSVFICGMWVQLPYLVVMFIATLIGVAAFVDDVKSQIKIASAVTIAPLALSILLDVNIYPLPIKSVYSLILDSLIFGLIAGILFSKVLKQGT